MANISFGGDAESFMDAPQMQNVSLTDTMAAGSGSFFAQLLDLVGIHRQIAKGPKGTAEPVPGATPAEVATPSVPKVLDDVATMLTPTDSGLTNYPTQAPITSFGERWLKSMNPIMSFDPGASKVGQ